jgi:hypothetical protein
MENEYENYNIVDMEKKDEQPKKKFIKIPQKNTPWKEKKTKKGGRMFYRKYEDKYINIGFFKSGHIWLTYDGVFVKDHNLKYTNDEQLKNDTDNMLDLIVNIAG